MKNGLRLRENREKERCYHFTGTELVESYNLKDHKAEEDELCVP